MCKRVFYTVIVVKHNPDFFKNGRHEVTALRSDNFWLECSIILQIAWM